MIIIIFFHFGGLKFLFILPNCMLEY